MESSLISGPVMSVIGITTVFVVLVSLVSVVAMMRRWFGEAAAPAAALGVSDGQSSALVTSDEPSADPSANPSDKPSDEKRGNNLLVVALATYAYHRSRGASATAPAQTTEWSSAGRARQIASFRR